MIWYRGRHTVFDRPEPQYAPTMVHELAHQWFGDSVAPSQWSDVWQNEGHATWYQLTFQADPDSADLEQLAQLIYSLGDIWRAFFGPVAAPLSGDAEMLFNPNVYYGGALVLYALREQVATRRSGRSSASGSRATAAARWGRRTSSRSRPRSRART